MSLTGGVVGFDFGTSNVVISQAKRGGVDVVLNESSKRSTASLVSFSQTPLQRFLGDAAVPVSKSNYRNTARSFKLLLGLDFDSPEAQHELSFLANREAFVKLPNGRVGFKLDFDFSNSTQSETSIFSMEQLTAMLLNKLRLTVALDNSHTNLDTISDVVISVPGFFTSAQRYSLISACQIAGFNPLSLINNHTAVGLSYGIYKSARNLFDSSKTEFILFIDIGFATTSVSLIGFTAGKLSVISASHNLIGGRDFDSVIFEKFSQDFYNKTKFDVKTNPKSILKLLEASEKAKQTLTPEGVSEAKISVEFLMNETDFKGEINLEEFERLSENVLKKIEETVIDCVKKSKVELGDISSVEIIGGATRPKIVKKHLSKILNLDSSKHNYGLSTTLNLDESVSRGCALYSAMLSPQFKVKEFQVNDANFIPIKVEWDQKTQTELSSASEKPETNSVLIIPENESYPTTKRVTFNRSENFTISSFYDINSLSTNFTVKNSLSSKFKPEIGVYKIIVPQNKDIKENEKVQIRVDFKLNSSSNFELVSATSVKEYFVEEEEKVKKNSEKTTEQNKDTKTEENKDNKADENNEKAEENKVEEKPETKKVKKFIKTPLKFETTNIFSLDNNLLKNYIELEKTLTLRDKLLSETAEAKNSLETYVYLFRDKVDSSLKQFLTLDELSEFKKLLENTENWLYDEGFDVEKKLYQNKLESLKQKGDRYELRETEFDILPNFISNLEKVIAEYEVKINENENVDQSERKTVVEKVGEVKEWLREQKLGQNKLEKNQDPVLTSKMIQEELKKLQFICEKIVNKKAPPKKVEPNENKMDTEKNEKAEEEKEKEKEKKENGEKVEMDVD